MRLTSWFVLLYAAILLLPNPAVSLPWMQQAQAAESDSKPFDVTLSYAPVVKKAAPAVVNIYTKSRVEVTENLSPFMNDPFFKQFFGGDFVFGGRPREQVISSLGSGVLIKPDGTIVTSYHVVKNAQEIKVVLGDKREFTAKVTRKDPKADLAFLKIDAPSPLPYLEMRDSDSLEVGDRVLAIGNPFGVGQTVTSGIVSALARGAVGVSDYQFFIQTDAAINPGNSGGALVDMYGRLVGINTAIYSRSGGSNGIGFAIPANMVRSLQSGKIEEGRVVRPWLGFTSQQVTPEIAESQGLALPQGVIVIKLDPHSPAERAGLKEGDIIIAVGGSEITSDADMQYRLALQSIGSTVTLKVLRDGKPQEITIALEGPPQSPREQRVIKGNNPLSGVTIANPSPALLDELGLKGEVDTGVMVVASNSRIFNPGDVILEINGHKITSTGQVEKLVNADRREWKVVYQRGNNVLTLTVD